MHALFLCILDCRTYLRNEPVERIDTAMSAFCRDPSLTSRRLDKRNKHACPIVWIHGGVPMNEAHQIHDDLLHALLESIPERGQNACLLEEVCLTALSTSGDLFLTKQPICPHSGMVSVFRRPFQNGGK